LTTQVHFEARLATGRLLRRSFGAAENNLTKAKQEQNPVERAVLAVGGPTKAARICGVSNAAVHKWIQRGSISLLRNALRLSRASGISIEEFVDENDEQGYK
jgi:hypothetical protein